MRIDVDEWQDIESMPIGRNVLVSDGDLVFLCFKYKGKIRLCLDVSFGIEAKIYLPVNINPDLNWVPKYWKERKNEQTV